MADTVHPVIRHRSELLLRDGSIPTATGEDLESAIGDALSELGLADACELVRVGDPIVGGRPCLFDCTTRTDGEWVSPADLDPEGWAVYEVVGPTVETVRDDRSHGAAYVSVRALEVLRDRAVAAGRGNGGDEGWGDLVSVAERLLDARPTMAVVENRIDRAMAAASEGQTSGALLRAATEELDRAWDADRRAAREAAALLGDRVLTLSRSGTVFEAIRKASVESAVVLESRPGNEGVGVAERLASEGLDVTLTFDGRVAGVLGDADTVLVGADSVLADGTVVNKVGTHTAAVVAERYDVPVYAVAATDKVRVGPVDLEEGNRSALYEGSAALTVLAEIFEEVPPELFVGVVTEEGVLDERAIERVAEEHKRRAQWRR
ncbi:translation initiation factor eIF-2B [Natronorarus salvus]|uniref:translation initiation factor eIF-2B n=1 Tax=Natronorarus salvus TaxID=3117733 RepID=UPI002F267F3D